MTAPEMTGALALDLDPARRDGAARDDGADRDGGAVSNGAAHDGGAVSSGALWNRVAIGVLPLVAAVGAVLSWGSLYEAASAALGAHAPAPFGVNLVGAAFPLLVDALILGASARYVAGVKAVRPVAGWRVAAHVGIAGTVLLNADAAPSLDAVPWHVTAPIVWSVLVELVARDVLGELQEVRRHRGDRIPVRLWLTTPAESVRISWRMARTGAEDADAARAETERCAAARDQLAAALPGVRQRRRRRQITRRLWAGVLDPATLAGLIEAHPEPVVLHRMVLRAIATGTPPPAETPAPVPTPAPPVPAPATAQTAPPATPATAQTATAEAPGAPARAVTVGALDSTGAGRTLDRTPVEETGAAGIPTTVPRTPGRTLDEGSSDRTPARTLDRTPGRTLSEESGEESGPRTLDRTPARTVGEESGPRTPARTVGEESGPRTPARTAGEESGPRTPARTLARTPARTVVQGSGGRRSEEELLGLVEAAIAAGRLPERPSGTAIQRELGGGKGPAMRVAARLVASEGAGGEVVDDDAPVIHLVHDRAEAAS